MVTVVCGLLLVAFGTAVVALIAKAAQRARRRRAPLASIRPCPLCHRAGSVSRERAESFHRDQLEAYSWRRSVEELIARPLRRAKPTTGDAA